MGTKEKIKKNLDNEELKELFEEIYEGFLKKGKDGIRETVENKVNNIKKEFEEIKMKIENAIGG